MNIACEYCGKTFSKSYNVYKHQRTAKYCLKLQHKFEEKPVEIGTCQYCGIEFNSRDNLKRHEKVCTVKGKSSSKDEQLLEMIIQLQKTIVNLSDRPVGTTNNNNNNNTRNVTTMNLAPITDEEIQEHLAQLTIDFIQEGAKGYANFANSYPFKNRVLCTDKARKKLRYKDSDGQLVDDSGGVKLAHRFFKVIAPRNEEIINEEYQILQEKVQSIAEEGRAYTADLTGLLTKATHLQDLLIQSRDAARGEENELTREFIRHLSKML